MRTIFGAECEYHKAIQLEDVRQDEKEKLIIMYFEWCLLHYIENSPKKELIDNIKKTCMMIKEVGVMTDYPYKSYIDTEDYKGIINTWKKIIKRNTIHTKLKDFCLEAYGIPSILLDKAEGGDFFNIETITIAQEENSAINHIYVKAFQLYPLSLLIFPVMSYLRHLCHYSTNPVEY